MKLRLVGINCLEKTDGTQAQIRVKRPACSRELKLKVSECSERPAWCGGVSEWLYGFFLKRLQSQEQVMAVYSKLNQFSV